MDYALNRVFRLRDFLNIVLNISYDSACSYRVNIVERFAKLLPEFKELVERARFSIDALHVNDHLDRCMYLLSAAYQECTGHFHGVGTEQYWSENNQMGPQTRQMNPGHRHDKIISHHSDWNWKKTGKHGNCILPSRFVTNIHDCSSCYIGKRPHNRMGAIC